MSSSGAFQLGDVATLYVTANGNDNNNGRSWQTAKATIAACQAAVPAGALRIELGATTLAKQSFTVDRDGLSIRGCGRAITTMPWDQITPAVSNSDPNSIRREFRLSGVHLYLQAQPASGIGVQWDNFYRGRAEDVWIDQLGVNGTGLSVVGSAGKSTYFGTFRDVDVTSGGVCVFIGDNCNGHEFWGGVLDGAGVALNIQPVTVGNGESKWFGTAIQTSNLRTANIGGGGAPAQNHEFHGLRVEIPGGNGGWVFQAGQGLHCLVSGGTWSGCPINPGNAADANNVIIPAANTFNINGNVIAASGAANQLTVTGSGIVQQGSAASANIDVSAKGVGAVTLNGRNPGGTAGVVMGDGAGGTAVAISAGGVFSGKKLGANATITGSKSGGAALVSLLAALQAAGLIVDSTTA